MRSQWSTIEKFLLLKTLMGKVVKWISSMAVSSSKNYPKEMELTELGVFESNKHMCWCLIILLKMIFGNQLRFLYPTSSGSKTINPKVLNVVQHLKILKIYFAKYVPVDILSHTFVLLFHNILFNSQFCID